MQCQKRLKKIKDRPIVAKRDKKWQQLPVFDR
jgi:hypothetical protein